jgi:hypothetical protein
VTTVTTEKRHPLAFGRYSRVRQRRVMLRIPAVLAQTRLRYCTGDPPAAMAPSVVGDYPVTTGDYVVTTA